MVRIYFLAAGLSCLSACTWSGAGLDEPSWQTAKPAEHGFRFDWQLSGDPAVAPLQVFDDGRETWLQFAPGQALPAIFGVGNDGERALPYARRDPYVVVAGAWKGLSFRGGRLVAKARRAQALAPDSGESESRARALAGAVANAAPATQPPAAAGSAPPGAETPGGLVASAVAQGGSSGSRTPPDAAIPDARGGAASGLYRAAPPDATLRAVLVRWADMAGWTFQPQHWAVDVDIPLSATAEFPGDFKSAVRGLLGATELAERPLQPCFYGNRVLRVVPMAQSCSRTTPSQGAAA